MPSLGQYPISHLYFCTLPALARQLGNYLAFYHAYFPGGNSHCYIPACRPAHGMNIIKIFFGGSINNKNGLDKREFLQFTDGLCKLLLVLLSHYCSIQINKNTVIHRFQELS